MTDSLYLYSFDEQFELQFLKSLCSRHGDVLIEHLSEESFTRPETKWFVKAALEIFGDSQKAPRDVVSVLQKLTELHEKERKITYQELMQLSVFSAKVLETEVADGEQTITIAASIVRKVESSRLVEEMDTLHAEGQSILPIAPKIEAVENIGKVEVATVTNTMEHMADILSDLDEDPNAIVRFLPFGIPDLDVHTGGGVMPGDLVVYLGDTGDGKSRFLNGQANVAMGMGLDVFWASNEMVRKQQLYQYLAATLVMDSGSLIKSQRQKMIAKAEMMKLHKLDMESRLDHHRGLWHYSYFKPDECTIEQVFEAFLRERDKLKREIHVLCIDYLKRFKYPKGTDGDYKGVGQLAVKAKTFAQEHGIYLLTAHQARKREKPDDILTKDSAADSHNLPRESDIIITLNPVNKGKGGIIINPAKLRNSAPMDHFHVDSALAWGCGHKNQVGFFPPASKKSYRDEIYAEIEVDLAG